VATAVAAIAGMLVTVSPFGSTNYLPERRSPGDVALYRAEVDRIHQGEGYYQAAASELAARDYPMLSVFNWRTPLPMWLLGKMPAVELGKALLGILALILLMLTFEATAREEEAAAAKDLPSPDAPFPKGTLRRPAATALLLTGAMLPTVLGNLFTLPVLWSGIWIALSICAYGIDRRWLGVLFGLTALFFRELALPYCVLCVALAWREKQRREWIGWAIGLSAWLLFFAWHCQTVSGLIPPNAHAHEQGWVQVGGAGFVISTAQMNAYLLLLPQWVTALFLVAALVGFAGWSTALGTRVGLTTCLFLAAFAMVGHSFNQYWGCMMAPLLCFGAARFPASLRDLWLAAAWRHTPLSSRACSAK
jgi:hypothetical protein